MTMRSSTQIAVDAPDPAGSQNACLAAAVVCLGLAITWRDGFYSSIALAMLTVSIGFTIFALYVESFQTRFKTSRRLDRIVISAAALMYVVIGLLRPPIEIGSPAVFRIAAIGSATCVIGTLFGCSRWSKLSLIGLLIIHAVVGAWVIRISNPPHIDVYVFQHDAAQALLRGQNPYTLTFPNIYGDESFVYAEELMKHGRVLFGYPYMPFTLLWNVAAEALGGDVRYGQLFAIIGTGALLAFMRPGRIARSAAMLWLLAVRPYFLAEMGWIEPSAVFMLALTLCAAIRWPRAMPVFFGLFIATKQYLPAAILVAPLLLERESLRHWRHWFKPSLIALAVALAVSLPLIVWNPSAFWQSAILLQFKQPFRFDSLSYLAWLSDPHFAAGMRPFGTPPPFAPLIAFLALIGGAALALQRRRSGPTPFAIGIALSFLLFFAFNKQAFSNYYSFVIGALCCAIAINDPIVKSQNGFSSTES